VWRRATRVGAPQLRAPHPNGTCRTRLPPGATRQSGGHTWPRQKYKLRATTEVLVGAVIGPITRPEALSQGWCQSGTLRMVGRTVPLKSVQSLSLADVLVAAGTTPGRSPSLPTVSVPAGTESRSPGSTRPSSRRSPSTPLNRAGCGVIRCDSSATGRSCIRQTYLSFPILEPPLSGTVELPQHAETGQGAELLLSVPSRSWRQSLVRTSSTIWTAPKRT
jgi:hypothetical protein